MTCLNQARSRRRVQVSPEGDDQHVAFERAVVRLDREPLRIDSADRGLHEPYARLDQVAVRMMYRPRRGPAEHHVKLREAEHEALGLVDEDHVGLIAQLSRQPGGQLQSTESCSQY